ncbi:hypothetical protein TWF281_010196 [Arthrobotrys megalospora]
MSTEPSARPSEEEEAPAPSQSKTKVNKAKSKKSRRSKKKPAEIPNLFALEAAINRSLRNVYTSLKFINKNGPYGLTTTESNRIMNRWSTVIENYCQELEANPHIVEPHFQEVHCAMGKFEHFRPYFTSGLERSLGILFWEKYKAYCEISREAQKKLKEFQENKTKFRITETKRFITEKSFRPYAQRLRRINLQIEEYCRVVLACRRFKPAQRDRWFKEEKPCNCREKQWERDAWAALGLPVIDMPAGSRGFAPV